MRIAFATGHYLPTLGGIESHVEQITRRLVARGDEVTILTQTDDRSWPANEIIQGVAVERFSVPVPSRHFAVSPALWRSLRARRSEWDIVHAHGYHSIVPLLARSAGAQPLVFTPHYHGTGHSPLRKALHVPYRRAGATIVEGARTIICVSEAERRLLLGHFPSAAEKTVVIPNGVDLEMLQAADPFPTDNKIIVSGGRLESYKNVDVVVQALALLPEDCELVVTGDGPQRGQLEDRAREMRVDHRVRFMGRASIEDLYRWYRTADVYVSMSSNEAMPVTLLEVLACGARVVCSDIPAHLDLKEKTQGSITIVPLATAANDLASAIRAAIPVAPSPDLKVATWDDVTDATRAVYEKVAGA